MFTHFTFRALHLPAARLHQCFDLLTLRIGHVIQPLQYARRALAIASALKLAFLITIGHGASGTGKQYCGRNHGGHSRFANLHGYSPSCGSAGTSARQVTEA